MPVVGSAEDHARHIPAPQIRVDFLVIVGKANQGIVAVLLKLQRQRAHIFRRIGVAEDVFAGRSLNDDGNDVGFPLGQ